MEDMAQNVRACGVEIVESLGERDLGRIVTFGGKVEVVQEFTASRAELTQAILGIQAWSGTSALYNALFIAVKYASADEVTPPLAVVVISDGKDTSSSVTREQLEQAAEKETARIYSVLLPTGNRGPRRGGDRFLKSLAESTQGKAVQPQNATDLQAACGIMAAELKRLSSIE
jgi:Mg-chelatase subunit ChlD